MNLNIDEAKKTAQRLSAIFVTYSTLIVGVLIIVVIIWATNKMTLDERNCKNMDQLTKVKPTPISNFIPSNFDKSRRSCEIEPFRRLEIIILKQRITAVVLEHKNDL